MMNETERLSSSDSTRLQYNTIQKDEGVPNGIPNGIVQIGEAIDKGNNGESCCRKCCGAVYPSGFRKELLPLLRTTLPIVLTQIGQMIIGPLSLIFCGHLGDPIQLDGAALAISMINTTCLAVGQGLGTACDTFFSQSFGSKNKKQVGAYLQRAVYIFLLALLPCYAFHINMEAFLILIGQHPDVSRLAGRYMIIFMPGTLAFFLYVILSKYLQNQNILLPNVVIGIVANLINAGLHYLFLYQLNWSTDGSAVAQAMAYIALFLLTLIYILVSKVYKDTWDGWRIEGLRGWGKFARLSIPGMVMSCMEWWGFEIAVILTGLLGTTELGAQSVLLQIDTIWFQVPLGIQIACTIRIGQHLGAGDALRAKTAAHLCITINTILSLIVVGLFLGLPYQLAALFTNVQEVVDLTTSLLPILALYLFSDGVAISCKGVLYGTGRQLYGTALVFVSYYLLALPIGIPLMFLTDLRSAGYWWALAGNLILQSIVLFLVVVFTNWEKEVQKAKERAGLMGDKTGSNPEPVTDEEKQPLLSETPNSEPRCRRHYSTSSRSSSTSHRRQRNVSVTLSISEIQAVIAETQQMSTSKLLCRRAIALVVMLAILGAGIVVKLLVEPPGDGTGDTLSGNFTTSDNIEAIHASSTVKQII